MKIHPMNFHSSEIVALIDGSKKTKSIPAKLELSYSELLKSNTGSAELNTSEMLLNFVKSRGRYKKGDLVWVRETFCIGRFDETDAEHPLDRYLYVDQDAPEVFSYAIPKQLANCLSANIEGVIWKPSTQMKRAFSRLTLRITNTQVERCNDGYRYFIEFDVINKNIDQEIQDQEKIKRDLEFKNEYDADYEERKKVLMQVALSDDENKYLEFFSVLHEISALRKSSAPLNMTENHLLRVMKEQAKPEVKALIEKLLSYIRKQRLKYGVAP